MFERHIAFGLKLFLPVREHINDLFKLIPDRTYLSCIVSVSVPVFLFQDKILGVNHFEMHLFCNEFYGGIENRIMKNNYLYFPFILHESCVYTDDIHLFVDYSTILYCVYATTYIYVIFIPLLANDNLDGTGKIFHFLIIYELCI